MEFRGFSDEAILESMRYYDMPLWILNELNAPKRKRYRRKREHVELTSTSSDDDFVKKRSKKPRKCKRAAYKLRPAEREEADSDGVWPKSSTSETAHELLSVTSDNTPCEGDAATEGPVKARRFNDRDDTFAKVMTRGSGELLQDVVLIRSKPILDIGTNKTLLDYDKSR